MQMQIAKMADPLIRQIINFSKSFDNEKLTLVDIPLIRQSVLGQSFKYEELNLPANEYSRIVSSIDSDEVFKGKLTKLSILHHDAIRMVANILYENEDLQKKFILLWVKVFILAKETVLSNESINLDVLQTYCNLIVKNLKALRKYVKDYRDEVSKSNNSTPRSSKSAKNMVNKINSKNNGINIVLPVNSQDANILKIKSFSGHQNFFTIRDLIRLLKYNQWLECMENVISNYIPTSISDLKCIVVGSIGAQDFCTNTAYIADETRKADSEFPKSVSHLNQLFTNLLEERPANFTETLISDSSMKGELVQKDGIFFFNICQSHHQFDVIQAACSIKFINSVCEQNERIIVLDLRFSKHTHRNNLNQDNIIAEDIAKLERCNEGGEFDLIYSKMVEFEIHNRLFSLEQLKTITEPKCLLIRLGQPAFWFDDSLENEMEFEEFDYNHSESEPESPIELAREYEYIFKIFQVLINQFNLDLDLTYRKKKEVQIRMLERPAKRKRLE